MSTILVELSGTYEGYAPQHVPAEWFGMRSGYITNEREIAFPECTGKSGLVRFIIVEGKAITLVNPMCIDLYCQPILAPGNIQIPPEG